MLFRPHEVALSRVLVPDYQVGEVRAIRPLGATTRVTLRVANQAEPIEVEVANDHASLQGAHRGETLYFRPLEQHSRAVS